jgi:amino acid adenylation domain-containing protein
MLIALLAVHKAGGAFVPLEPTLPSERLAFLLRDGAVGLVLSDTTFRDRLPSGDLKIVALDELEPAFEGYPESNLLPVATGQNLAYVLYTSGSTGQPKGVEITHYGLNNYLSWCASEYFGRSGSGSAVHTPLGFDLTVTSLLAPLAAGQSVTLLPESGAGRDLLELAEQEAHFRVLKLTPGHLRMLARTRVRCRADVLVVGGEALSGDDLRDLAELMPDARIVNEYGPTEAVVGCSVESFPIAEVAPGPVSIGRPIQNARLYVLDSHGDLAPVGVPGELHIGGIGVARGYLNRPGLTAERFIPDPFSDVPGSHMFRSGDLARLGADGKLEYLGRGDQQVKVRGYRVELGEIEETLRSCDGVAEALVIKVEEQLVAYVAPAEGSALDERSLHGDLTAKLPDYMVPAAFVFLEEMPLNRNGKVDRAALPEPVRRPTASPGIISNTSPLGQQIASIWREVLHLDHVDEQANFFDLGGDSLSLVKVHSRLQDLTGAAPPLIELFRNPTVEKLANLLASETSAQPAATAGNRAEHRLARLQPARKRMSANA